MVSRRHETIDSERRRIKRSLTNYFGLLLPGIKLLEAKSLAEACISSFENKILESKSANQKAETQTGSGSQTPEDKNTDTSGALQNHRRRRI